MTSTSGGMDDDTESANVDRPIGYDAESRRWLQLSVGISLAAVAALVVHLVWPQRATDTVTLGLLFIAFVPWLAPLVSRLKLPGGAEVEFREIRRDMARLAQRVETVERWALDTAIPADVRDSLHAALTRYASYLDGIPLPRGDALPQIYSHPEGDNQSFYLPEVNSILLGGVYADDPDMALHEYTHVMLDANHPGWSLAVKPIESGLAAYLPCSFLDRPYLGGRTIVNAVAQGISSQDAGIFVQNDRRVDSEDETPTMQNLGQAWAAVFWEIRSLLGQRTADRLLVDAWTDDKAVSAEEYVELVTHMIREDRQLADRVGVIQQIFIERGAIVR